MAIEMGFSEERIRSMTLPQLNAFIQAYNEMHSAEESERWATQDDIDALA